ncbi:hypothetical protein DKX38_018383 [Salix brachista]|uniref:Nascent polypeptide-associated complex subunit beta n=1 Tax=Salix brachista TaxID=2182728 RepID=A0A5N5KMW1_9ROSI|nr:hypothetical protein DKX38_018383 [Salix brachista]
MDREKLQKMASAVRTGGKGSVRSESVISDIQLSSLLNEICAGLPSIACSWVFCTENLNAFFYEAIEVTDKEKITWLLCFTLLLCSANEFLLNLYLTCRKKKAIHKTTTTDDKRLQSTLKRIGVNAIPAIEEVNIFKDDIVIQFLNPKVQASVAANTWVVSGSPQTKKLQDILPQVLGHLGHDNLENLKKLAEQIQKQVPGAGSAAAAAAQDDDDDVPDLVPGETFEAAAEEGKAAA